ncbi:MAG: 16S rRNA (guanine(527)-N(7))-methyltransferase RsmG [Bacteroidales bacterium]|nr:MAG: 16S rRNA (guanine(527)-N(7))-methyltransferase RsmG [Bacteroidales bacterium]
MDRIIKYFPDLSSAQRKQLSDLEPLYRDWNSRINVISRKDIDNIFLHHVLHSLAIAKVISFTKNTRIIDIGTGGGFPGIPLAIYFPYCNFTLVDSIGKKIAVANEVIQSLGLINVNAIKSRAEELNDEFDFVVTRAVAPLPAINNWAHKIIKPGGLNQLPNGIIALKGGDLKDEIAPFGKKTTKWEINSFFEEDFFNEKRIIFLPR